MKNIFLYLIGAFISLSLVSCDDTELEDWDSAVLDYSGTYLYQVSELDGTLVADYDNEHKLEFYNTSADVANELWIDDHDKYFELRSKFFLDGDASNFKSKSIAFADLTNNEKAIVIPDSKPTALGETIVELRSYIRAAVVEGKIIKDGATTLDKNIVDSLNVSMVLYSGSVTFKSEEVPVAYRANPDKEEFKWVFDTVAHDATKDEAYIIAGHRYSGFTEDDY
ncbi:hypothetical protein L3049_08595 [Labilibaculum sp. DW002]|uniref:Lipid-binding hydrolase n=1 Tax=Paralabilibaculum antarcticum TaxID=2912572 RepID=A0ABT5VS54_9BACT|nr:lipid-binding protein [Labilibaculum sp. DW002]MDE5418065.1 hypothetical protein [Labilibaculum sp. DW002]